MSGNILTKKSIAAVLAEISEKMGRIAQSMEYINEQNWKTHAYELMGASDMIRSWIADIKAEIETP